MTLENSRIVRLRTPSGAALLLSGAALFHVGEARADVVACRDYLCPTITVSESPPKVRFELPATPAFESCTVAKRSGTEPSSIGPTPRLGPAPCFTSQAPEP